MPDVITIDYETLPESNCFEHCGNYYNRETWVQCYCNGEPVRITHTIPDANGNLYHPANYFQLFVSCFNCEVEIDRNQTRFIDGNNYCENCYSEGLATCTGCAGPLHVQHCTLHHNNGLPWHTSCYDSRYAQCNGCDCFVDTDDPDDCRHTDNGWYCNRCEHYDSYWNQKPFNPENPTYEKIGSQRKFGLELETADCEGYKTLQFDHIFAATPDASIRGIEFVSPILFADEGLEVTRKFCKETTRRQFKVDQHCGFHVHLDVGDLDAKQLLSVCAAYQLTYDVWCCFVPDSRVRNRFCTKNDWDYKDMLWISTPVEFLENSYRANRQQWFNIDSYNRHKTFENRLHTATLSHKKVCNWVKANLKFIDRVKDIDYLQLERMFSGSVQSMFNVVVDLWNDHNLGNFYAFRSRKFGKALSNPRPQPQTVEAVA